MDNLAPDDILVLVCHPQAEAWMPLREWMRKGSGSKPLIRPIAAKHAQTGESLPLTAIPLAVRNDPESWEAVRLGWIHDPDWPNEFYNARIDRVDAKEGTLRVTAGQDQRNIVIADDTEMILLDGHDYREMKDRLNDVNLRPGATVILMTKRKGTEEIAFQLQLIAQENATLACGKADEP